MAIDIVNGTDAAIVAFGGGTEAPAARAYVVSSALTTDAQGVAGVQANGATAVLKSGSTSAQKALVAGAILDSILTSIDLSTLASRKAFRLKQGLDELYDILALVGA